MDITRNITRKREVSRCTLILLFYVKTSNIELTFCALLQNHALREFFALFLLTYHALRDII
nr:MAG TPA: hypothetical protein [Caudoviricetes sp.]